MLHFSLYHLCKGVIMKAKLNREFDYTFSVTRTEGTMSVYLVRNLESIVDAILFIESNLVADGSRDQIIVEWSES